jgi:hypothetical protein
MARDPMTEQVAVNDAAQGLRTHKQRRCGASHRIRMPAKLARRYGSERLLQNPRKVTKVAHR